MTQINDIREMTHNQGLSYSKIKEITGFSYETIKKYDELENFSPELVFKTPKSPKIDPFKKEIRKWLESDKGRPRKQKHTLKRIHKRLQVKYPDSYNASYRTLCEQISPMKKEIQLSANEYLELQHSENEAQVDFGKAQFYENGIEVNGSYLVLSLPYSNAGYLQLFRGETLECVLEGLKSIFKHIGHVPSKIWFDNLSSVVRIKGRDRKINSTFQRFSAHYGFSAVFMNPNSGNEKGNVENKVGYLRRNYLVPVPNFFDIHEYNKRLLELCDKDHERLHYRRKVAIKELLEEQKNQMKVFSSMEFEIFRIEKRKCNKYGNIEIDTNSYSISPSMKSQEVLIKLTAYETIIFSQSGSELIKHKRCYGQYQSIISYKESLELITQKIRSLENTYFYQTLPNIWKEYFKDKDNEQRRRIVRILTKILVDGKGSIETATAVLREAQKAGTLDSDSMLSIYYRLMEKNTVMDFDYQPPHYIPNIEEYSIDFERYNQLLEKVVTK